MCQAYEAEHNLVISMEHSMHDEIGYGRCKCGHYASDHSAFYTGYPCNMRLFPSRGNEPECDCEGFVAREKAGEVK